jgi:hypothetical protein
MPPPIALFLCAVALALMGKTKANLSLFLKYTMKMYGGVDV